MEGLKDFKSVESSVQTALIATTRSASQLANEDLVFYRSLDSALGTSLDRQNARLLGLAERIMGAASASSDSVRHPRLSDIESVDGNWRVVVDVVDSLLERADTALDEFTGAVKRLSPGAEQAGLKSSKPFSRASAMRWSQTTEKPQLSFENVPTNNETKPFQPLLTTKPHAITPFDTDAEEPAHPYQKEIEQFEYPNSVYTHTKPIPYHPFESTEATYVDSEDAVDLMLNELKQAKEIAIDLEHHDQRSYIGIVSLMQISTRDKDWIIDTLKPWRRRLHRLNEVFADPGIIKVLHGAFMDIIWLQRDLGLYLVGLFDTHYAARALGYTGGSLAFLLKKFVNVDAQKQYQTADWRIRPLPQELVDYARSDTHYLLYIFDCMRNELIEKSDFTLPDHQGDKIWEVLQKSSEIALQKYEHPTYDATLGQGSGGWYKMLSRSSALLSKIQFAVFRAVHKWRDDVARAQDDSTQYVMPNHEIFSIAKALPSNKNELISAAHPLTQTVKLRVDELLGIIQQAKMEGDNGPEMIEVLNQVEPQLPRGKPSNSFLVGPVLPVINASRPAASASASASPLRSLLSSFWGNAFDNSSHQKRPVSTATAGVSLTLPLSPLTAEVFVNHPQQTPVRNQSSAPEPPPASTPGKESEDEDVFVLKNSKKRKRSTLADNTTAQADEVGTDNGAIDRRARSKAEKAERKKAKKAAKRAHREVVAEGNTVSDGAPAEEQPFDYASMPSLLDPPAETRQEMRERKKREKNPYAKAMDAPKGLPRVQKEKAGKTMTYVSR